MENLESKNKTKSKSETTHSLIRISSETRKKLQNRIEEINQKDFGKNVRTDELISLALDLVRKEHIERLQQSSLSNHERMDREYKAYIAKHGPISKDEYLGMLLKGSASVLTPGRDVQ